MGINTSLGTLLAQSKLDGTRFDSTATIGRQSLTIPGRDLQTIAARLGITGINWVSYAADGYADDFIIRLLGAQSVTSIDYSDYESASIVHDLNTPIPEELNKQFDAVIDAGTLEHVFDIKQVLANYMRLVRVGGDLFILAPANNLCGHGFYQFSPEFFYRVLSAENGFTVKDMILIESPLLSVEISPHLRYFRVADPEQIGRRVELVNSKPVMIYVHARRVSDETIFSSSPYQSDYNAQWKAADEHKTNNEAPPAKVLPQSFRYLSRWSELRRRLRQRRKNGLRNNRFFTAFRP